MSYNNNYANSNQYICPRLHAELPIPRWLTKEGRDKIITSINQTQLTPQDYWKTIPSILGTYSSSCGLCSRSQTGYFYDSTRAGASPF